MWNRGRKRTLMSMFTALHCIFKVITEVYWAFLDDTKLSENILYNAINACVNTMKQISSIEIFSKLQYIIF